MRSRTLSADPLAALCDLPAVRQASEKARDSLHRLYRHRQGSCAKKTTLDIGDITVRAARASAVLDKGPALLTDSTITDPIFQGSLRVAHALEGGNTPTVHAWRSAPLQVLARLHSLASAQLLTNTDMLGRPRTHPGITHRLDMLATLITGGTHVPAPILAAVIHGELLTLSPFHHANGIVARAASRLVTITTGLDAAGLGIPEIVWMRKTHDYHLTAQGFATGDPHAVGQWLLFCCEALCEGATETMTLITQQARTTHPSPSH